MSQLNQLSELDDATRGYLKSVKEGRASGYPGVYVEGPSESPMLALIIGLVILVTTVFITVGSTDDAARTALLQTAGFILGGWLILSAFRTWLAVGRGTNLGRFQYADPNYVWIVEGTTVRSIPIPEIGAVRHNDITAKDKYIRTETILDTAHDGTITLRSQEPMHASRFADFVNAVKTMASQYPAAADLTPAQLGANALKAVEAGKYPEVLQTTTGGLNDMLPHPTKVRTAMGGVVWPLLIIAAGIGCFLVMKEANVTMRDDAAYDKARAEGNPGLWKYLIDDRNKLHRTEVETKLDAQFEEGIAKISSNPDADKARVAAFTNVLRQKKKDRQMTFGVHVEELENPAMPGPDFNPSLRVSRQDEMVKKIGQQAAVALPQGLLFFFPSSKEDKTALKYTWKFVPSAVPNCQDVAWTLTLNDGSGKPFINSGVWNQVRTSPVPGAKAALDKATDSIFDKILGRQMVIMEFQE